MILHGFVLDMNGTVFDVMGWWVVAWQGARKEGRTSVFFSGWKTNTINSQFTQTPFVSSSRSSTSSLINQSLIHIIH
jgi:hypothetical protein